MFHKGCGNSVASQSCYIEADPRSILIWHISFIKIFSENILMAIFGILLI